MGERLTLRLFKGPTQSDFEAAVARVARGHGGDVLWNTEPQFPCDDFRTSCLGNVHAAFLPYQWDGADYLLFAKIGETLNVPWIEARIQEGSHWDYSLYAGGEHLDTFSTLPEYWVDMTSLDADDQELLNSRRGRPDLLAKAWNVPQSRIENYLKGWGWNVPEGEEGIYETLLRGRAYPDDAYEYGDIWQLYDFVRTLGALDPMNIEADGKRHSLRCPGADRLRPRPTNSSPTKRDDSWSKFVRVVIHKFTRE
jgi:hypothetical protein